MFDFEQARVQMVDSQVRPSDVTDKAVIAAFARIPRERFVDGGSQTLAYRDNMVPLTNADENGRALTAPRVLARMIQALELREDDSALVIGCGSGYASAIIGTVAESVIALESDESLAVIATERMLDLDIANVVVVEGALQDGFSDQAPYSAILVDGAVDALPEAIFEQMTDGGRLVTVEGSGPYGQVVLYTRAGASFGRRTLMNATAPKLAAFERLADFSFS